MAQYVIGDVHGQFASFCRLLQGAGLVDGTFAWSGEDAALFLMGDFFGHSTTPGPHGLAAVDLTMRLEAEAAAAGGEVAALLGNHDVLILAARRFGHLSLKGGPVDFLARWREDGGAEEDLENLTPRHVAWLESLPAMLRAGETLLVHADAGLYEAYGATVEEVNTAFATILKGDDAKALHHLLDAFGEHNAFRDEEGKARAEKVLIALRRAENHPRSHAHQQGAGLGGRGGDRSRGLRGRALRQRGRRHVPGWAGICLQALGFYKILETEKPRLLGRGFEC